MSIATRPQVYAAIDGERDYQDAQQGNAKRHEGLPPLTTGEIILCMERCLNAAREAWYKPDGSVACLPDIRKVVALGVQAMERYGAPQREGFERIPNRLGMAEAMGITGSEPHSQPVARADDSPPVGSSEDPNWASRRAAHSVGL